GVPAADTLSAGVKNADGTWTLSASDLKGLTLLSPGNDAFSLTVTATSTATSNGATTSVSATLNVTVTDVPPSNVVLSPPPPATSENGLTTLTGSFSDPGIFDTHTLSIDWGDGLSSTIDLAAGVTVFGAISHQYFNTPTGGSTFTINVTVTD